MNIKKELLEYLIRTCIREVLHQTNEVGEPTIGAPAPPADGTGAGENLAVPEDEPTGELEDEPALAANPKKTTIKKGLWFVNPSDRRLSNLKIDPYKHESENMESIVKDLISRSTDVVGQYPSMSGAAKKAIMSVIDNPDKVLAFVYIGEDGVIQSATDIESAKNNSIAPEGAVGVAAPTKGIYFVDPQEPNEPPMKINISPTDSDAVIEKKLYDTAATVMGRGTRASLSATRMAKNTARTPSAALFLYIDTEGVLQANPTLDAAKAESIAPESITGPAELPIQDDPTAPMENPMFDTSDEKDDEDDAWQAQQALRAVQGTGGRADRYGPEDFDADAMAIDNIDEDLKETIKKMVKKMLK